MISVLSLTLAIILLYLLYPVILLGFRHFKPVMPNACAPSPNVSLVLLTYNGINYIEKKIDALSKDLGLFPAFEFIVIDDYSTDGTREMLESLSLRYPLKLILKNQRSGVPHSMNLAAKQALYDVIVFCDQRQKFPGDILSKLICPLQNEWVGAVSGNISCLDTEHHWSLLRKHENLIKKAESRMGCLIGVYGPLFAIRKSCYREIKENIILDDLYLSLKILGDKKIVLMEECLIVDENFSTHYDFKRSRRYLTGLMQVLKCKGLFKPLPFKIKIMLLWHKYLRLLMPPMIVVCCVISAILAFSDITFAVICGALAAILSLGFMARKKNLPLNLVVSSRIIVFYFISMIFLLVQKVFSGSPSNYNMK